MTLFNRFSLLKLIMFAVLAAPLSLVISPVQAGLFQPPLIDGDEPIYIYSNDTTKTFLGCLNCGNRVDNSIFNYVSYYSNDIYPNSIFNPRGKYGKIEGDYGVVNPNAKYPPLLIGKKSQKQYGVLSLGPQGYHSQSADTLYQILRHKYQLKTTENSTQETSLVGATK